MQNRFEIFTDEAIAIAGSDKKLMYKFIIEFDDLYEMPDEIEYAMHLSKLLCQFVITGVGYDKRYTTVALAHAEDKMKAYIPTAITTGYIDMLQAQIAELHALYIIADKDFTQWVCDIVQGERLQRYI